MVNIDNYDGFKGYMGLERLEGIEFKGRTYLINPTMLEQDPSGDMFYSKIYQIVLKGGSERAVAIQITNKGLLKKLTKKFEEELNTFEK